MPAMSSCRARCCASTVAATHSRSMRRWRDAAATSRTPVGAHRARAFARAIAIEADLALGPDDLVGVGQLELELHDRAFAAPADRPLEAHAVRRQLHEHPVVLALVDHLAAQGLDGNASDPTVLKVPCRELYHLARLVSKFSPLQSPVVPVAAEGDTRGSDRLVRRLGAGGTGEVRVGRHVTTGGTGAVKLFRARRAREAHRLAARSPRLRATEEQIAIACTTWPRAGTFRTCRSSIIPSGRRAIRTSSCDSSARCSRRRPKAPSRARSPSDARRRGRAGDTAAWGGPHPGAHVDALRREHTRGFTCQRPLVWRVLCRRACGRWLVPRWLMALGAFAAVASIGAVAVALRRTAAGRLAARDRGVARRRTPRPAGSCRRCPTAAASS